MKGFIVLSFAFLAVTFYELSGGADYEPRIAKDPLFVPAVTRASMEPAAPLPREPRVSTSSGGASSSADTPVVIAALDKDISDPTGSKVVSDATPEVIQAAFVQSQPSDQFVTVKKSEETRVAVTLTPKPTVAAAPKDLRNVTGNRVNMRNGPGTSFSVVTKLIKGDRVEVLEDVGDGWLKLRVVDTDEVGYMADWLVTASN